MSDNLDIEVSNFGSFVCLVGATPAGKKWIDDHIDDALPTPGMVWADYRYVRPIIDGAESDGLVVG